MGHKISGYIQRFLNFIISFVLILIFIIAAAYALFVLNDNRRIYSAAENVQEDMLKLKPDKEKPDFSKLCSINPDVCAWLTMDGTHIDYPVLQGETNLTYINRDIYGQFALAGSIFLDCQNAKDFTDSYNLLYLSLIHIYLVVGRSATPQLIFRIFIRIRNGRLCFMHPGVG